MANREPTRSDFKNAIGDATAVPKQETLYDFELGSNYNSRNYHVSINLYYMKYKDQLVNTGQLSSVGYAIQTNVDDSYRAGIEIMNDIQVNKYLNWQLNLTFSSNKINHFTEYSDYSDTSWTYLGNLPRELGTTNISYSPEFVGSNIILVKPFKQLEISLISKYVGKQYFDNTSDENRTLDPYFVNHLKLFYSPKVKFAKQISFFVQVNNLLNVEYESNAYGGNWYEGVQNPDNYLTEGQEGSWAYYYPQAGINFLGGFTLEF
jgi:iron complex outermembrane receptor protein